MLNVQIIKDVYAKCTDQIVILLNFILLMFILNVQSLI